jgi:hypothetical protein
MSKTAALAASVPVAIDVGARECNTARVIREVFDIKPPIHSSALLYSSANLSASATIETAAGEHFKCQVLTQIGTIPAFPRNHGEYVRFLEGMIDFTHTLLVADQEWFFGGVAGAPGADWKNANHYRGPTYPAVEAMRHSIEAVFQRNLLEARLNLTADAY